MKTQAQKRNELKEACQWTGDPTDIDALTDEQVDMLYDQIEKGLAATWSLMTL